MKPGSLQFTDNPCFFFYQREVDQNALPESKTTTAID